MPRLSVGQGRLTRLIGPITLLPCTDTLEIVKGEVH